ncbi:MAG: hypothetical protein A2406_00930 [Candidatus Komeilibacteria bacterium RIFOXYC1_FULL_37_11]|uniref:PKD domain-containing protein n=1 Tax=Candidatus Komeilibacteria bacterium RIFOXYC1_FULL_37_11 TaxID=1798555 RepID=A0A1G2BWB2_9BACT|nr:MAG: hypothetical protein A2406_00930 [Candidatus Komeilibacteria bacterium RIFOXYC1_FULL_37_11]OGY95094.1 MAG: hypothetical protein A2611_00055 [Candidatus Komeilibacteria bacterium RIFOXYD1_FULL_37_29]
MEIKAIFRYWWVSLGLMLLLFFVLGHKVLALASDLVFSEIMYDVEGSDVGKEWAEVYNFGSENLVVSDTWRFFDSSYHKISLYQGTSTIATNEFFVLADKPEQFLAQYPSFSGNLFDTVINLSNSSSTIALSFDEGISDGLVDYYEAGWGGGGDGYSLEKIDFLANTTSNWQESFVLGGTPGQSNSQRPPAEAPAVDEIPVSEETSEQPDFSNWSNLLISELLPNPLGSDNGEWMELYNNGESGINIVGLAIKDNASRIFTIEADSEVPLFLAGHDYLLLPKSLTGLSLNNSGGEAVVIFDPEENIIDKVEYHEAAVEGRSYARDGQQFFWTKTPTPGSSNQISVNQAPVAQIQVEETDFIVGEKIAFSAEQSYDPEGDELDYLWQLPDGKTSTRQIVKHSFDQAGSYTIGLVVTDSEGLTDTAEFVVNIYQTDKQGEELSNAQAVNNFSVSEIDLAEDDLIISEFIPNPVGSDDGEWIEIYNASDQPVDLFAWQIDDQDGGSRPWEFSTSTVVLAKDFLLLNRKDIKLTLNNDQDAVRLLTPAGDIWQEVKYEKIPEGQAYAFDVINKEWVVTQPSPGVVNIFIEEITEEIIYSVSEIFEQSEEQSVLVQGVAINNTDKNSRSLYLADYDFSAVDFGQLIEVYSYYKNFPQIEVGQLVSLRGVISRLGDLPRVKIKSSEDVLLNDVKIVLPQPEIISVADLETDFLGDYISVRGTVVKKSGQNIYLATSQDEEYNLRISSSNINKDLGITKGDELMVSGILTELSGNFKLLAVGGNISLAVQKVQGEKIIAEDLSADINASSSLRLIDQVARQAPVRNILIFGTIFSIIAVIIFYTKRKFSR